MEYLMGRTVYLCKNIREEEKEKNMALWVSELIFLAQLQLPLSFSFSCCWASAELFSRPSIGHWGREQGHWRHFPFQWNIRITSFVNEITSCCYSMPACDLFSLASLLSFSLSFHIQQRGSFIPSRQACRFGYVVQLLIGPFHHFISVFFFFFFFFFLFFFFSIPSTFRPN